MSSQSPTVSAGRHFGPRRYLPILITVAATIFIACAAAVASASRPASAASSKHRACTSIISLDAIKRATQLPQMQYIGRLENPIGSPRNERGRIAFWEVGSYFQGDIPGSVCGYNDLDPTAPFHEFETIGVIAVGYGESEKNWQKVRSQSNGQELNSNDVPDSICVAHAPESRLKLGYGSQAFLNTMNLVACQDSDPTTVPGSPMFYYLVTVLTKRHDILTVGFYNAPEPATVALVVSVLKSHEL